ncbi:TetR/AcrR family transcriptional regulator C-terminal domain-containing protein [Streptomyces sp. NBC_00249]|uniref:TetR/AcrR family transcriptional regulator n=1 Tax=Streptomyces sp. NBC_00249 TaxID=2975690 RepID=UPI0022519EFA|nr:TetR/AcrR family transcriptional regulator C-terminal domain-containing protein [Streptomyces sp. NBC_00249]MCX5193640.1 TetR/AcrR family transcriptional regulator C-terminal domain-containing protein [Streptomyces sp. NBC_00249]
MAVRKKQDDSGEPPAPLWQRLEGAAAVPRQILTPQLIATTAVAIADADGLDAITMRRLATDLGVAPMAAYRYVSGKEDVLELMVDLAYAELSAEPVPGGWRAGLRAQALDTRELMLRHPWLVQLSPQTAFALTPHRMAAAERALAVLEEAVADPDARMAAVRTVEAYVHGAVGVEVSMRQLMAGEGLGSGHELREALAPQMVWLLRTGRYPAVQRYVHGAVRKDDAAWQFEAGLDAVIDGLGGRFVGGGAAR